MSKVKPLSPEGVKRVSDNVDKASQKEVGGKAITNFKAKIAKIKELAKAKIAERKEFANIDAKMAEIKELASTNPELALEKTKEAKDVLDAKKTKHKAQYGLIVVAGFAAAGVAFSVGSAVAYSLGFSLAMSPVFYNFYRMTDMIDRGRELGKAADAIRDFADGRINKDQLNKMLGIDTKKTKQSVNTSSEEVKAKPNNNNGNPADTARKVVNRNNPILKNKNTHLR